MEKYINPLFEIADEEYRIAFFCQLVIQLLERVFSHFPLIPDAVENGVEAPPEQKNEGYGTQICKRCSGVQKVFDGECQSFNASPGIHAIQRIPEFFGHGNHA